MEREGRVAPIDDPAVKQRFIDVLQKMYTPKQAAIIREQFLDFVMFSSPNFSNAAKQDLLSYGTKKS